MSEKPFIPDLVFIEPAVEEFLDNPDALSQPFTVFRMGGWVNGERALPFLRVTDEVRAALQKAYGDLPVIVEAPADG